jgi:uncharacterized membrane protein
VDLQDWLIALHVLAAFSLVAALVLFSVVIAFGWNRDRPSEILRLFRASRVGDVLFAVGSIGTILFGVWLAIQMDEYSIFDGWVIAALVLWVLLMETGRREGKLYNRSRDRARELAAGGADVADAELRTLQRSQTALLFHVASCVLALLLILDMIWKPGA